MKILITVTTVCIIVLTLLVAGTQTALATTYRLTVDQILQGGSGWDIGDYCDFTLDLVGDKIVVSTVVGLTGFPTGEYTDSGGYIYKDASLMYGLYSTPTYTPIASWGDGSTVRAQFYTGGPPENIIVQGSLTALPEPLTVISFAFIALGLAAKKFRR